MTGGSRTLPLTHHRETAPHIATTRTDNNECLTGQELRHACVIEGWERRGIRVGDMYMTY